jgi:hypothetical protein
LTGPLFILFESTSHHLDVFEYGPDIQKIAIAPYPYTANISHTVASECLSIRYACVSPQ